MSTIKYIIADDHKIFRQGLKLVLDSQLHLKCVGEASDGEELLKLLQKQRAHVILLDLEMPGMNGIEATRQVRKLYPEIRILILTMHDEERFVLHVIEAGANGYLLKNAEAAEISRAIDSVMESNYYFNDLMSITMLKALMNKHIPEPVENDVKLTKKEIQVLKLICEEYNSYEIAEKLYLSHRTVEGIRAELLGKTGARNTVGLVLYAIRNGIIRGRM